MKKTTCLFFAILMLLGTSYVSALSTDEIADIGESYYINPFEQENGRQTNIPDIDYKVIPGYNKERTIIDYARMTMVYNIDSLDTIRDFDGRLQNHIVPFDEYIIPVLNQREEIISTVVIRQQDGEWVAAYCYVSSENLSTLDALSYLDSEELKVMNPLTLQAKFIYDNMIPNTRAIFLYDGEKEFLYPIVSPPPIEPNQLYTPAEYFDLLKTNFSEFFEEISSGDGGGGISPGEEGYNIFLWIAIFLIASLAIVGYYIWTRRRKMQQ